MALICEMERRTFHLLRTDAPEQSNVHMHEGSWGLTAMHTAFIGSGADLYVRNADIEIFCQVGMPYDPNICEEEGTDIALRKKREGICSACGL